MRLLLGLGGNQWEVAATLAGALAAVAHRFPVVAVSSLWRTGAVGPPQPDFLNAAAILEVDVHPLRVLAFCQHLEAAAGRRREGEVRHGPRPLDLDLLMVPGLVMEGPALTLPHPRLAERRFALLPAAELAAAWVHPRRHLALAALAALVPSDEQLCHRLGPFPWQPPRRRRRGLGAA